jgi:hypothetical protein
MAFYLDALLDDGDEKYFTNEEGGQTKCCSILYPFYRYGEYESFDRSNAKYYVPGSSVKGALTKAYGKSQSKAGENAISLFVDDISEGFTEEDFEVITLLKSQYFKNLPDAPRKDHRPRTEDVPQLKAFFDGTVGVEAMKPGVTFTGTIGLAGDLTRAQALFKTACDESRIRLDIYEEQISYLREQAERAKANELKDRLSCVLKRLLELRGQNVIFLGGYKGLLRSIRSELKEKEKEKNLDFNSAIFVDSNFRPFGIVECSGVDKL